MVSASKKKGVPAGAAPAWPKRLSQVRPLYYGSAMSMLLPCSVLQNQGKTAVFPVLPPMAPLPGTDASRPDLTKYILWISTNLINIRHMFDWFISTMAFPVMEFQDQGYKIKKIFA